MVRCWFQASTSATTQMCRKWLQRVLFRACSVQRCEMPVMHAQNTVNGMLQEFSVRSASLAMLLPVLRFKCRGSPACFVLLCSIHA